MASESPVAAPSLLDKKLSRKPGAMGLLTFGVVLLGGLIYITLQQFRSLGGQISLCLSLPAARDGVADRIGF